ELEVGRGNFADVAEAQQRLEQFRLDLVTKTSDVITTERQLRNLLGLPAVDDRRIVPVSAPTEAKLEPDWDACRAVMVEKQPDIAQQKAKVKEAERKAADIDSCTDFVTAFLPGLDVPGPFAPLPTREHCQTRDVLERQRAYLQQVIHQTTHSLAR